MKKVSGALLVILSVVISSCTINGITSGPGGGAGSGIDDFSIADQIVKGSMQVVGQSTNDVNMGIAYGVAAPGKSTSLKYITVNLYFSTNRHYNFNCTAWGGAGSVDADLGLSNHTRLLLDDPDITNLSFIHSFVMGDVIFRGFKLGKMTGPINGTLQGVSSVLNEASDGTVTKSFKFQGDVTNGGGILQVHFEYYEFYSGADPAVKSYSNCTVNGQPWVPNLI